MRISPADWRPRDIDDLEPAAWDALRAGTSAVTAGPGAGKSEFLAQRAAYLFETGICRPPRKILAISFKRDAAANLRRRVDERLPEHAGRFASMTFDGFTKSIVDRFRALLPDPWGIDAAYKIGFRSRAEVDGFLNDLAMSSTPEMRSQLLGVPHDSFLSSTVGSTQLQVETPPPTSALDHAVQQWWAQKFQAHAVPTVDFVMLNRLAELAIRNSPQLGQALRATYPFVFVDEFQDTTYAQYSFLRSVFGDGNTTITVVGDAKQRIMGWAGAHSDAFAEFEGDFNAERFALSSNYRSSQQLVDLQHLFAQRLDPASERQISRVATQLGQTPTQIWSFSTGRLEAESLASWVAADIETSGKKPADYALIARQKVADLEPELAKAFVRQGLKIRNDDALVGQVRLQDLLKDETVQLLIGLVRIASARAGQARAWRDVTATMSRLLPGGRRREVGSDVDDEVADFVVELRSWFTSVPLAQSDDIDVTDIAAAALTDKLTAFLRFDELSQARLASDRPEDLEAYMMAFRIRLAESLQRVESWDEVAAAFVDEDAVPLLTVHRSKGLEYNTVFFIGLDGDQWWAHAKDVVESTMTFFVGVSRAAERLIFTQCDERGSTQPIADIYALLASAGVSHVRIG
jgi:superfamily I DNA/RNA helicase